MYTRTFGRIFLTLLIFWITGGIDNLQAAAGKFPPFTGKKDSSKLYRTYPMVRSYDACPLPLIPVPVDAEYDCRNTTVTTYQGVRSITFGPGFIAEDGAIFSTAVLSAAPPATPVTSPALVQDEIIKVTGITTDAQIYALNPVQKQTIRKFFDGLGRPIQAIAVQASPAQNDIISFTSYNSLGQQLSSFLPYVNGNSGSFHTSASSEQTTYYSNGLSDKVVDDSKPWSQKLVESSPLQRILNVGTEGNGFQPSPADGTQHYKSILQRSNNSTAYTYDSYNTGIRMWNYDGTSSGVYPTGSLSVTQTTDEANNVTIRYKDIHNREVLKRQIITSQTIDGSTENCLDTYYVFDDAGELRVIIPPKAVALIRNAGANPWSISLSTASTLVFQYNYDVLGRLIEKKIPSSDWTYIIYDPLNRPVLTQDGILRGPGNTVNKWTYYKYDIKGRMVSQGIYKDAVNGTNRASMQAYVNGLNYSVNYYEERQTGTSPNFYTNNIFPITNQDGTTLQTLLYCYYDDYDLNGDGIADYSYQAQGLTGEATSTVLTRAKPTILYARTLNNDGTLDVWLQSINFYDKYGNLVQVLKNNHTNAASLSDLETIVPDPAGLPQQVKTAKTVSGNTTTSLVTYGYDNAKNLVTLDQSNNGGAAIRIARYVYNELGQLVTKQLHSTDNSNFLQNIDFRYNIKGVLTSINNSTLSVDNTNYTNSDANDLFGEEILFEKTDAAIGNSACYNGNISAVKWESQSTGNNSQRSYTYNYDQLDRLSGAFYKDRPYQSTGTWSNMGYNDEKGIQYDLNGNIKALQRYLLNTGIDLLTYTYNGNQLTNVTDLGTTAGFNGTNTGSYSYDNSGNLTADPKKGITISYNVLNKTDKITFTTTGNYIRYTYDAAGNVIRKDTYNAGTTTTYDYIDGLVYQNLALSYFAMAEGRVRNNAGTLVFEYFIRDHLGNVRVSFDGTGSSAVAKQENSYYPFGMTLPGNVVPSSANKNLFNGGSEWQNDFGNLPDLYQTFYRNYDAVLGRFISVDPKAGAPGAFEPYHFANNNPVSLNDPDGDLIPAGDWLEAVVVVGYPSGGGGGGISVADWYSFLDGLPSGGAGGGSGGASSAGGGSGNGGRPMGGTYSGAGSVYSSSNIGNSLTGSVHREYKDGQEIITADVDINLTIIDPDDRYGESSRQTLVALVDKLFSGSIYATSKGKKGEDIPTTLNVGAHLKLNVVKNANMALQTDYIIALVSDIPAHEENGKRHDPVGKAIIGGDVGAVEAGYNGQFVNVVIAHELGHILGSQHYENSIMAETTDFEPNKQYLRTNSSILKDMWLDKFINLPAMPFTRSFINPLDARIQLKNFLNTNNIR